MSASHSRESGHSDEALLHRLGYAQVLYREMGGFSNFAISFTIISILAGCLTSYYIAFNYGGPVAITWGWLIVGAFSIIVSMAMGEIASSMPTAGALYFWASKLGNPAWGWFTGWFNLVGQISVTAAIDYGAATFTTALLNLWFPDVVSTETSTIFIVFTVIIALHIALNLLNINLLAQLNTISAWWHMVGVAVVVVILADRAGAPVRRVRVHRDDRQLRVHRGRLRLRLRPRPDHVGVHDHRLRRLGAHERGDPAGVARRGDRHGHVGGGLGLLRVHPAGRRSPSRSPTCRAPSTPSANAVVYIWTTSLGNAWAEFLLLIAVVAQFFCGTASVTSASRMMFAFSRDRAVPGSTLWRKVARNRVPVNAVIAIGVLAWLIMVPSLFSLVAYLVATSIAVIGLNIAFALPIILRIRAGDSFEAGAWSLGRHYKWISPLAVAWIAFICIVGILPVSPNGVPGAEEFDWEVVNYSPITVVAALILFGGWYLISARKWFTGPIREAGSDAELADIERELRAP